MHILPIFELIRDIIFSSRTDKQATASTVYVYTVMKQENRTKVVKFSAADLWSQNYKLRINNLHDKSKKINSEKDIKNQVD